MQSIKIAFASCFRDHVLGILDRFSQIAPDAELWVVSEFQPPKGRWIPYRLDRSPLENLRAIRNAVGNRRVAFVALSMQPRAPYNALRWLALGFGRDRTLVFNENYDHFILRPSAWRQILRYLRWKSREYIHWQTHAGGDLYTFLWRLRNPREFRRPLARIAALRVGERIAKRKQMLPRALPVPLPPPSPAGISIVIPSRDGRDLLAALLPVLSQMIEGREAEIIVVDNGSSDGSAAWLGREHPRVRLDTQPQAMSFARAVNRGIELSRYSHVLLLNNDMRPHDPFLEPLEKAFEGTPELFCATAQIYFPEGKRREETGKAVISLNPIDRQFPVECAIPVAGEDGSPVFYGSGGCSLYDKQKLQALGGFTEIYDPAYVEDLDIGFRAWQRGWPSIFVARAGVTHHHRATTSRFFDAGELDYITERNYLRFLARSVENREVFRSLWKYAIERLNWKAAIDNHQPSLRALLEAPDMIRFVEPAPETDEERILAIGSGDVAVFPGRQTSGGTVVLIATPYVPFPLSHGGAVRMYNLMKRGAADFGQVLLTFVDEIHTPPPELLEICREIVQVRRIGSHIKPDRGRPEVVEEFDTPAFRAALHLSLRKWKPAIVQLEFTQMALYAEACAPAKTVMVEHDITIDLYQQLLTSRNDDGLIQELERWRTFETDAWRRCAAVVLMSEKDRASVVNSRRAVSIPNGVDLDRFQPSAEPPDPKRILFIGSFQHMPNLLAIDFFLREIWPKLQDCNPVLHIIAGTNHMAHYDRFRDRVSFSTDMAGIEIDGFVSDVRPAYRQASIVIAPLLASAGTNIKIMEAMAMGKAVVSTSSGVNGLNLRAGEDTLVENDPDRFASTVRELIRSPELCRAIGLRARRTVEQNFDWDRIADLQKQLYEDLIKS